MKNRLLNILRCTLFLLFSLISQSLLAAPQHFNCIDPSSDGSTLAACKASYEPLGAKCYSTSSPPPGQCPPGSLWIYWVGSTECTAPEVWNPDVMACGPPAPCGENQERNASGNCQCVKLHPQTLECVGNCASLKGSTFSSTNAYLTGGSRQGCAVSCSLAIGDGPWATQCTYLGTEPTEGGVQEPEEGEAAPLGSEPAPADNEEGEPQPCPPGTVEGTVNGQRYCAPDSGAEPSPPTDPSETDPTGLGPKVDSLKSSVEKTRAAVEATGNAINRQTALLNSGLEGVVKAINDKPVGGGGGGGTPGDPAGDCDPTEADYFQCAGLIEEVADTRQQELLDEGNAAAELLLIDHEAAATALREGFANDPIAGPSGLQSFVTAVLPQPTSCTQMTINFPGHTLSLPCERFDFLKQVIGWALAIFTMFLIWGIATRPQGA